MYNKLLSLTLLTSFICCLLPPPALGSAGDSLYDLLRNRKTRDTITAEIILEYAFTVAGSQPDSLFKYNDIGFQMSEQLKFKRGILKGYNLIGREYFMRGMIDSAMVYFKKGLATARATKNQEYMIRFSLNCGIMFSNLGRHDSARYQFTNALDYAKEAGDELLIARSYSELGSVYALQGDYMNAIRNQLAGLTIFEKRQMLSEQLVTHVRLGNIFNKMRDFRSAKKEYLNALKINETIKNPKFELDVVQNMGLLYQQVKKDQDSALIYLEKAKSIAENMGDDEVLVYIMINTGNIYYDKADFRKAAGFYQFAYDSPYLRNRNYEMTAVLVNLGSAYLKLGDMKKAGTYLPLGLAMADSGNYTEFRKIACESMAEYSEIRGEYKAAYEYLKIAHTLHDSIFNRNLNERIMEIRFQHEMDKVEAQNKILLQENKIKQQTIENQRIVVTGIVLVLLLTLTLLIVILRNRRKQKELILRLDEQNVRLQEAVQTKDKFLSIVAHDLRSPFSGLLGLLTLLDDNFSDLDEEEKLEMIHTLKLSSYNTFNLLENLLEWSRANREKIDNQPEKLSLASVAESSIASLQSRSTIKSLELTSKVDSDLMVYADPRILSALLGNLINNSIKFTPHGGKVCVYAESNGREVAVFVEDNGIGIPEADLPKLFRIDVTYKRPGTDREPGTGLGLVMCKEYVKLIGGEISITSEPGKRTCVRFTVPVPG